MSADSLNWIKTSERTPELDPTRDDESAPVLCYYESGEIIVAQLGVYEDASGQLRESLWYATNVDGWESPQVETPLLWAPIPAPAADAVAAAVALK